MPKNAMPARWLAAVTKAAMLAGAIAALPVSPARAVVPPPATGTQGMVVTAQHLATDIGLEILKQGGNAIDAAVAVGYALAVVHPCCGNLGGGGFMTIHMAKGGDHFVNFRETAPGAARADMYLDKHGNVVPRLSLDGYLAAGVPGTVMGLDTALAKYGTMSRSQVMAPAIDLASSGFVLTPGDAAFLAYGAKRFARDKDVAKVFLHPDGTPLKAGDRLVQPDLAATLQLIAQQGPDAFYKGPIARKIVAASKAHGGILTEKDFAGYKVELMTPVSCAYRGYTVVSAPPPSSGGTTLCEILEILDGYAMPQLGFHSAASVHDMVEAMRHAYVDRNSRLGDPDFVKDPVAELLSARHIEAIRAAIPANQATPSTYLAPGKPPHEGTNTTQYSIVDKAGDAVSVTYTINSFFGAGVIAPGTGFFLNNEMDDFTSKPGVPNQFGLVQGQANAIAPHKRPLSSMAPTIVEKDGQPFLVTGSPGGSRIITITLETILNVIDNGMNVQEAVDAPRIHQQWLPDAVYLEPYALSPDTASILTHMGYHLKTEAPWGAAEMIEVAPGSNGGPPTLYGANDDRRPAGLAEGY